MRPVCSGAMYASVPSSAAGALNLLCSLRSRVAIPKSISVHQPVSGS